jgi:hypothetical protein
MPAKRGKKGLGVLGTFAFVFFPPLAGFSTTTTCGRETAIKKAIKHGVRGSELIPLA